MPAAAAAAALLLAVLGAASAAAAAADAAAISLRTATFILTVQPAQCRVGIAVASGRSGALQPLLRLYNRVAGAGCLWRGRGAEKTQ